MERIIAACKNLQEARRVRDEAYAKMRQLDEWYDTDELFAYLDAQKEAEIAEENLREIRKNVLGTCITKREERRETKVWIDKDGKEHAIEYVVI